MIQIFRALDQGFFTWHQLDSCMIPDSCPREGAALTNRASVVGRLESAHDREARIQQILQRSFLAVFSRRFVSCRTR
jgi:hypothetical protein